MEVKDDEDQRKSEISKVTENKNMDCKRVSNYSHLKIKVRKMSRADLQQLNYQRKLISKF